MPKGENKIPQTGGKTKEAPAERDRDYAPASDTGTRTNDSDRSGGEARDR